MKKLLLLLLPIFMLSAFCQQTMAQAITLGAAGDFVLFTASGAVTNTGNSFITGNVGTDIGAITGFGNVNGVMHTSDGATGSATAALLIAYGQLNTAPTTSTHAPQFGTETLNAGVYAVAGDANLNGNLTLDAQNNQDAVFIFKMDATFSTSFASQITLINGAKACNVYWKVEGAVNIASQTIMRGTVVANNGAIDLATGVVVDGRILSTTGAITLLNSSAKISQGCGRPIPIGPAAPDLKSVGCYAIFTTTGNVTNAGTTKVKGDVGSNSAAPSGYSALDVNGTIHLIPDPSTAQAASDLTDLYNYLNGLSVDIELLYPAQFGNDLVLTPHTYLMNAATSLTGTVTLNGEGNADAVFVIQIKGALTTGTNAKVVLTNGTQAKNVYWNVDGAVSIADYSQFKGTIIANNGAIALATGVNLEGRILSTTGLVTTTAATVTGDKVCGVALACNEFTGVTKANYGSTTSSNGSGCFTDPIFGKYGACDEDRLIDNDDANFATLNFILLSLDSKYLEVTKGNPGVKFEAGLFAGFEISSPDLINLNLFGDITIATYSGSSNIPLESKSGNNLLLDAGILLNSGHTVVGFTTTLPFDRIRITQSGVKIGIVSTTNVYRAVVKKFCEGPDLVCNNRVQLSSPTYPLTVDESASGIVGVGLGSSIVNLSNVIDADLTNYAQLNKPVVGLGSSVVLSVRKELTPFPANTFAGFDIQSVGLLGVGVLDALTVELYNNGTRVQYASGSNLLTLNLLGSDRRTVGVIAQAPYDEIRLTVNYGLASVSLLALRVYGPVVQLNCNQLPNSNDVNVMVPNRGSIGTTYVLDNREYQVGPQGKNMVQFPPLTGTDPEDGDLGAGSSVRIITVPENAVLKYDGTIVTPGQVINNYDSSKLTLTITQNGSSVITFTFAFIDAAGQEDPTPATYTITFPSVLPVQLISFTAKGDNGDALLNWSTSNEANSAGFGVEHSSDGNIWSQLGFVNSKSVNGNSNQKLSYQYTDRSITNGTHYYRLKQTDLNGEYAFSNIAKVDMNSSSAAFKVYPNPSSSYIFIEYSGAIKTPVRIIDMNGRIVKSLYTTGAKTIVETNELPAGTYVISIDGKTNKFTVNR